MENESHAATKAKELEARGIAILLSSPSIFELYVGVSLSKRARAERSKIESIIESLPQLPLDFESGKAGGLIYGEKLKGGLQIDPEDAMIAGISRTQGHAILTRNVRHFSGIAGVKIEEY